MTDREDFAADAGDLTSELMEGYNAEVTELLDRIVTLLVAPAVGAASVSLASGADGPVDTLTATSRQVRDLDGMQHRTGGGPCLQALDTGQEVVAAIPTDRWPAFSAAAAAVGFGISVGAPPRGAAERHGRNAKLEAALETRNLIGEAKGLLMAWQNINSDEAFDILRRASQRTNRKARDIAAEMVARVYHPSADSVPNL